MIVSIYLVLCGTLQKKRGSFQKALAASQFPLKRFFPFFLFFLFHTKEMVGNFPKTFIISNAVQEKVFSLFSFLSSSHKGNNWECPKDLHDFKFYRGKGFSFFSFSFEQICSPFDVKYLKILSTQVQGFICMLKINT